MTKSTIVLTILVIFYTVPPQASAESQERQLDAEESMALFRLIAVEHDKALDQFSQMVFTYRQEAHEVREASGDRFVVDTTVSGREKRSGERLLCDVNYEHRYPVGNPGGFGENWRRQLVLNDEYLAFWVDGTGTAFCYEVGDYDYWHAALRNHVPTTKSQFLLYGYGDGNMTFSEFALHLEHHKDWRVAVTEITRANVTWYEISQFQSHESQFPYRVITLCPDKGYIACSIVRYTTSGAVYDKTDIKSKKIRGELWIPSEYESLTYNVSDSDADNSNSELRRRYQFQLLECEIGIAIDDKEFGLNSIGASDGQVFSVQSDRGAFRKVLYKGTLLPPDIYSQVRAIE